jgi:hypothetical protein
VVKRLSFTILDPVLDQPGSLWLEGSQHPNWWEEEAAQNVPSLPPTGRAQRLGSLWYQRQGRQLRVREPVGPCPASQHGLGALAPLSMGGDPPVLLGVIHTAELRKGGRNVPQDPPPAWAALQQQLRASGMKPFSWGSLVFIPLLPSHTNALLPTMPLFALGTLS